MHKIISRLSEDNDYTGTSGAVVRVAGTKNMGEATTKVTQAELDHLSKNEVFKTHIKNGFIRIIAGEVTAADQRPVGQGENNPDMQTGSNFLINPEKIEAKEDLAAANIAEGGAGGDTGETQPQPPQQRLTKKQQKAAEEAAAEEARAAAAKSVDGDGAEGGAGGDEHDGAY